MTLTVISSQQISSQVASLLWKAFTIRCRLSHFYQRHRWLCRQSNLEARLASSSKDQVRSVLAQQHRLSTFTIQKRTRLWSKNNHRKTLLYLHKWLMKQRLWAKEAKHYLNWISFRDRLSQITTQVACTSTWRVGLQPLQHQGCKVSSSSDHKLRWILCHLRLPQWDLLWLQRRSQLRQSTWVEKEVHRWCRRQTKPKRQGKARIRRKIREQT